MATKSSPDSGYLGKPKGVTLQDVKVIDGVAHRIHKLMVHKFQVGDVEDPEIYAAQPIYEWINSEKGAWILSKSIETPVWHRYLDYNSYGYTYGITAYLKDIDYTFYTLKWGQII
jgi:hypothetical protein